MKYSAQSWNYSVVGYLSQMKSKKKKWAMGWCHFLVHEWMMSIDLAIIVPIKVAVISIIVPLWPVNTLDFFEKSYDYICVYQLQESGFAKACTAQFRPPTL